MQYQVRLFGAWDYEHLKSSFMVEYSILLFVNNLMCFSYPALVSGGAATRQGHASSKRRGSRQQARSNRRKASSNSSKVSTSKWHSSRFNPPQSLINPCSPFFRFYVYLSSLIHICDLLPKLHYLRYFSMPILLFRLVCKWIMELYIIAQLCCYNCESVVYKYR